MLTSILAQRCGRSILAAGLLAVAACSAKYDWRDAQDGESPYTVLMPAKPSQLSRDIQIGDQRVSMRMNASQVGDVRFAVGAAHMADPTSAQLSIGIVKDTLLRNLDGKLTHDKTSVTNAGGKVSFVDEFDAINAPASPAQATAMIGKLVARDGWIFQVLVVGPASQIDNASVQTFLESFKPG